MEDKPFESMNMIPFIDIMLVLLTIVLTTSTFIASGRIPVHLPQASGSALDKDSNRIIEIDAQGRVFLDGKAIAPEALPVATASFPKSTPFLLRADKTVQLQRFIDVADALKQSGFSRVAVQTQQSGRP
ncbi:biopolymer transporter ExbD [Chitinivorax sp. PXF-14]|uniref:ExbD/TolR family protein n=1 Tax=Chitinivorax sp. PXF-14 TaxID=3230488 RepID=UPI003467BA4F